MQRPVFFNLRQIQMPVGALTSITHRVRALSWRSAPHKVVAIVFIWALAHHLLAGIRHLLTDVGIGSLLPAARRSA